MTGFYNHGPAGRARELRRQLDQAIAERDDAREWACLLEQKLARNRVDLPLCRHGYYAARCPKCSASTDQASTGSTRNP